MSETKQPKDDKKRRTTGATNLLKAKRIRTSKRVGSPGSEGNRAKRIGNSRESLLPLHPGR
jgi:hypothetical protein